MRFRPLFLLFTVLLTSCGESIPIFRLDFVGSSRFTSSNRTVSAGDTITTRVYAESEERSDDVPTHLRITVTYTPTRLPIAYPTALSTYNPDTTANDDPLVYLDSTLNTRGNKDFVFQTTVAARTT